MPTIRELEIRSEEDANMVKAFAQENYKYLAKKASNMFEPLLKGEIDKAISQMSLMMTEAYTSGMADAMERFKNGPSP